MAEYIDRENYCKNICRCSLEKCDKAKCPIWTAPAADVRENVQAKWEWMGPCRDGNGRFWATCPTCGERQRLGDYSNFCPCCGADMRKR